MVWVAAAWVLVLTNSKLCEKCFIVLRIMQEFLSIQKYKEDESLKTTQ